MAKRNPHIDVPDVGMYPNRHAGGVGQRGAEALPPTRNVPDHAADTPDTPYRTPRQQVVDHRLAHPSGRTPAQQISAHLRRMRARRK